MLNVPLQLLKETNKSELGPSLPATQLALYRQTNLEADAETKQFAGFNQNTKQNQEKTVRTFVFSDEAHLTYNLYMQLYQVNAIDT